MGNGHEHLGVQMVWGTKVSAHAGIGRKTFYKLGYRSRHYRSLPRGCPSNVQISLHHFGKEIETIFHQQAIQNFILNVLSAKLSWCRYYRDMDNEWVTMPPCKWLSYNMLWDGGCGRKDRQLVIGIIITVSAIK